MKFKITLLLLVFPYISFGQNREMLIQMMDVIKLQDTISREVFLDSTMMPNMKLSHELNWRNIWSDIDVKTKSIDQFYDIRIMFKTEGDAKAFHKKYLDVNSENGPEIKKHKIDVEGITDLHIYSHNATAARMFLDDNGLQAFCMVFIVDNYFVKFYITCLKEYKPDYFVPYIEAARDKIMDKASAKEYTY